MPTIPSFVPQQWDEQGYLAANPDVAAAVARGEIASGAVHFGQSGHRENRQGHNWGDYYGLNPDVADAVARGEFASGWEHWLSSGHAENRNVNRVPADSASGGNAGGGTPTQSSAIAGLGTQMGEGFSGINTNISELGNSISGQLTSGFDGVNTNINEGFAGVDTRLNNLNQDLGSAFDQTNQNMTAGFNNVTEGMNDGFASAADARTDMQSAIMGGQNDLRSQLEGVGNNLNNYYNSLSEGQTQQQNRLGTLQTDLTGFEENFNKRANVNARQLADLSGNVVGGFSGTQAQLANAVGGGQMNTNPSGSGPGAGGGFAGNAPGGPQNSSGFDFGRVARALAQGSFGGTPQEQQEANAFVQTIGVMRDVLTTQGNTLNPQLQQAFSDVVSSFSPNGQLVPQSVDQYGNQIARGLDASGNMAVAMFDQTGQVLDQRTHNLNQLMSLFVPTPPMGQG